MPGTPLPFALSRVHVLVLPQAQPAGDQRPGGPVLHAVRHGHRAAALPQPGDGERAQPAARGARRPVHALHALRVGQLVAQPVQRGRHQPQLLRAAAVRGHARHEVSGCTEV